MHIDPISSSQIEGSVSEELLVAPFSAPERELVASPPFRHTHTRSKLSPGRLCPHHTRLEGTQWLQEILYHDSEVSEGRVTFPGQFRGWTLFGCVVVLRNRMVSNITD